MSAEIAINSRKSTKFENLMLQSFLRYNSMRFKKKPIWRLILRFCYSAITIYSQIVTVVYIHISLRFYVKQGFQVKHASQAQHALMNRDSMVQHASMNTDSKGNMH